MRGRSCRASHESIPNLFLRGCWVEAVLNESITRSLSANTQTRGRILKLRVVQEVRDNRLFKSYTLHLSVLSSCVQCDTSYAILL